jgi:uncharacterized protein
MDNPLSPTSVADHIDVTKLLLKGPGGVAVPLERTLNRAMRRRGLLGRDGLNGALLIDRCRSVHTVGMRFALDVAFVSLTERVLTINSITTMPTGRFGLPRFRSNAVLEAEAGSFVLWGLMAGQRWGLEP